jgi:hypothetical protein
LTTSEILAELNGRGIPYRVDGADLIVVGAKTLPVEMRDDIRAHKVEIIAALVETDPVQVRVRAFRQQLAEWREIGRAGVPFFVLLDAIEIKNGECQSCGDPVPERPAPRLALRCDACVGAAEVVMVEADPEDAGGMFERWQARKGQP